MAENSPDAELPAGKRFRILVCIDRSEESYRGLRYAVRIGSGTDADITLLYVRSVDKGLRSGGLQIRMARENLLDWGLELPGTKALKKGRDMLVEMGFMEEEWGGRTIHMDVQGDPLGDNMIEYTGGDGRKITLKLMVSPTIDSGILDECEMGNYDIAILSAGSTDDDDTGSMFSQSIARTVATEHRGTVIVARELEEAHGHLICVNGSPMSLEAAKKDAEIASRCFCPIHLFSVASDESELENAKNAVAEAKAAIEEKGLVVFGEKTVVGDPVEKIVEEGRNYSLIVLSASDIVGFRRFFQSSVAYKVLERAHNSVMICR